jgi:orotidine-5'-phosphate decarboxylase
VISYRQLLYQTVSKYKNFLCLGFDLNLSITPAYLAKNLDITKLEKLSHLILETFAKKVPAVKFQIAFFESLGWQGIKLLEDLSQFCKHQGQIVIIDAKRGDISTTMCAYAQGLFDRLKADAITISPYMGKDTLTPLAPWLKLGKGAYILGYTSNPSGVEIQSKICANQQSIGENIFSHTYQGLEKHLAYQAVGTVIGANSTATLLKNTFFNNSNTFSLIPGIGAQKGAIPTKITTLLKTTKINLVSISRGLTGLGCSNCKNIFSDFNSEDNYRNFLLEKANKYTTEFSIKD